MSEKQFRWAVAALLIFAALLAYANSFANDFVWDDASSILLHQDVQNPANILQLFTKDQHAYGRGQGNFYRPLVSLTFMIDTWLSRPVVPEGVQQPTQLLLSPFIFHVSNTLWHAAAAIAFFALMTIAGAPRPIRVLAPLLYVVHPLHTEAVTYISGRADPMAGALVLGALCCALAFSANRNVVWSSILFVAALLSKESATIYPFLLLLAVLVLRPALKSDEAGTTAKRSFLLPLISAGVIVGVYAALRFTVLRFASRGESVTSSLMQRVTEAGQAFALYVKLMVVPTNLHMERTLEGVPGWAAAAGWVLIIAFAATAFVAYTAKRERLAFALGFFLITWLPISGIFPLNAPMAEHWMYLPMLGFIWALFEIVWMLAGATVLRYPAYAIGYAACLAFTLVTAQRNYDWRNNESLYVATLKQNPNTIRVAFNLGVTYEDLIGNESGARREFERVLALYKERKETQGNTDTYFDDEMEAHLSLGRLYAAEQKLNQAAAHFETLRRVSVNESNSEIIANGYLEYARLLASIGRADEAKKLIEEGTSRVPALQQQREAAVRAREAAAQQAQTPQSAPAESTAPQS